MVYTSREAGRLRIPRDGFDLWLDCSPLRDGDSTKAYIRGSSDECIIPNAPLQVLWSLIQDPERTRSRDDLVRELVARNHPVNLANALNRTGQAAGKIREELNRAVAPASARGHPPVIDVRALASALPTIQERLQHILDRSSEPQVNTRRRDNIRAKFDELEQRVGDLVKQTGESYTLKKDVSICIIDPDLAQRVRTPLPAAPGDGEGE